MIEKRDTGKPDRGALGLEFKIRNQRAEDVQTGKARLLMRRQHLTV